MPDYEILSVSAVAQTVMVAFRQPDLDKQQTLVWTMDLPPGNHTLWEVVPGFVDFPTAYFLPITRFMASR